MAVMEMAATDITNSALTFACGWAAGIITVAVIVGFCEVWHKCHGKREGDS